VNHQRVLLFARYADLLGSPEVRVSIPENASVSDLIAAVRQLPGGEALPAQPMVAVNLAHAAMSTPVRPGDDVALLPPLAGG
jgi:molybdopterin converting factor small subunit